MLKKQISLILSLLLILSSTASMAYAADDVAGLKYKAEILVYNSNNDPTLSFECGDKIRVDIVLNSTGVATAPLYAMQGRLLYDSSCLSYKEVKNGENTKTLAGNNAISFSFLDKAQTGVKVSYPFVVASLTFEALQDGTTELMFNQFDVTNADATKRDVDYSSLKKVTLGNGIRTENKPALMNLINVCKDEMGNVIVSANADDVSIHSYWVKQDVYDRFKAVVNSALAVYQNETSATEDVSTAMKNLDSALEEFKANRAYGTNGGSSSSGGKVVNKIVTVTATADEHGKISEESLEQKVTTNTSVTIVSVPDAGYEVDKIYVNGEEFEGKEQFTIAKVTNDTVVKVTFKWKNVFGDVKSTDWFYSPVMYVNENGLMNGTSANKFEPKVAVTRGMFVTVLYRLEKEPATDLSRFADVKANDYFAKAVGWAEKNNIVSGVSNTKYAPNENVTREQMATIIYRYAKFKGIDLAANQANYADSSSISEYAKEAVDFCTSRQILSGKGNNEFAPQDKATRAEIATVLQRIIEKLK